MNSNDLICVTVKIYKPRFTEKNNLGPKDARKLPYVRPTAKRIQVMKILFNYTDINIKTVLVLKIYMGHYVTKI